MTTTENSPENEKPSSPTEVMDATTISVTTCSEKQKLETRCDGALKPTKESGNPVEEGSKTEASDGNDRADQE
eukprot:CAMPEP_0197192874 /NCGR_PEP_ID=MMETSP1423-20130617/25940_1 /TAXON_ID=476441 /ORGANISM="Pseudo-nitzschia heimii, Strain UNC1101" /LENGTH=72 /DNA_ID=CAMNT_0042645869 /DNA_START=112 /DNA_END=327 /DNA_ORIENTATION=+